MLNKVSQVIAIMIILLLITVIGAFTVSWFTGGDSSEGDSGQITEPSVKQEEAGEETTSAGSFQYDTTQEEIELPKTGGMND